MSENKSGSVGEIQWSEGGMADGCEIAWTVTRFRSAWQAVLEQQSCDWHHGATYADVSARGSHPDDAIAKLERRAAAAGLDAGLVAQAISEIEAAAYGLIDEVLS